MKTKLSFLLAVIFILSMMFASCGNASTTAQTTIPQNSSSISSLYTGHKTMDDLLFDIKNPYDNNKDKTLQQEDAACYQKIKDNGKVYYADVKLEGYTICEIVPGYSTLTYYLWPEEASTAEDVFISSHDMIVFRVEYEHTLQAIVERNKLLENPDDGSFYFEGSNIVIFEFDGIVCQLTIPKNYTGGLNWQDIIDVKYIEIEK